MMMRSDTCSHYEKGKKRKKGTSVEIKVSGVIAGSRGAMAMLSLNDGPPSSFCRGSG